MNEHVIKVKGTCLEYVDEIQGFFGVLNTLGVLTDCEFTGWCTDVKGDLIYINLRVYT